MTDRLTILSQTYMVLTVTGEPTGGEWCRVYWGSHGCRFERGHDEPCECDCCDCPEGHHDGIEAPELVDDEGVICVAKPPYYGADTKFYGEDVEDRGLPRLT